MPGRRHVALWSIAVVCLLGFLGYFSDFHLQTKTGAYVKSPLALDAPRRHFDTRGDPIKVFTGVFSVANKIELRNLLREQYHRVLKSGMLRSDDVIVLKHVIGLSGKNHSQALLDENARHGDLLLLHSPENMDDGKSFFYFRQLGLQARVKDHRPTHPNADDQFDFVMKLDDDSWLNVPELVRSVRRYQGLPEVYYGSPLVSRGYDWLKDRYGKLLVFEYMSGMGYLLSKDICKWFATDEALKEWPTRNTKYVSWEDAMIGAWLFDQRKLANVVLMSRSRMSDFWHGLPFRPTTKDVSQRAVMDYLLNDLDQRTVLVHRLKTPEMMLGVAQWFWEHPYEGP